MIARHIEDRGGGLARVDGRVRLVEGLALPSEELESSLRYYNSATYWIDIDRLLACWDRPAIPCPTPIVWSCSGHRCRAHAHVRHARA